MLLLLSRANLTFRMTRYVNWLMKQAIQLRITRPMCDGCPFASSPLCRVASRCLFSLLHVAFCLCRLQPQHVHVLRYCAITQNQCSRPYGTATCILQTAIRLGTCQSISTQVGRSNELVLVCHRISPFSPTICWPVGLVSLEWPLTQPGGCAAWARTVA